MKVFFPDLYINTIYEVPYEQFKSNKYKVLLFDIDNTLVAFNQPEPTEKLVVFLKKLTDMGFSICLLSNNNEHRVKLFNEKLKLKAVHKAGKPGKKGILLAMQLMGSDKTNTVLIGDQIFTDIWCGNINGLYTVLVKPISDKDEITVAWKRYLEKIVLRGYKKAVRQNRH